GLPGGRSRGFGRGVHLVALLGGDREDLSLVPKGVGVGALLRVGAVGPVLGGVSQAVAAVPTTRGSLSSFSASSSVTVDRSIDFSSEPVRGFGCLDFGFFLPSAVTCSGRTSVT